MGESKLLNKELSLLGAAMATTSFANGAPPDGHIVGKPELTYSVVDLADIPVPVRPRRLAWPAAAIALVFVCASMESRANDIPSGWRTATGSAAHVPMAIYVATWGDDMAPGTRLQPLATIQHAIDIGADGDSVMLADGTYTGNGNRDLDFLGKTIRVASTSMDPTLCILDCADAAGAPHFGFIFSGTFMGQPELAGLTVTGTVASSQYPAAIMTPSGHGQSDRMEAAPVVGASVAGARESANGAPGIGPILRRVRVIHNTGDGFSIGAQQPIYEAYDCAFSFNTAGGGAAWYVYGGWFENCEFSHNGDAGLRVNRYGGGPNAMIAEGCRFNDNGDSGLIISSTDPTAYRFIDCQFSRNVTNGLTAQNAVQVDSCVIVDNGGWGVEWPGSDRNFGALHLGASQILRNRLGGVSNPTRYLWQGFSVENSVVMDNDGPGIIAPQTQGTSSIVGNLIVGNHGGGLAIGPRLPAEIGEPPLVGRYTVANNTIARNSGAGLSVRLGPYYVPARDAMDIDLSRNIICYEDTSVVIEGVEAGALTVSCSDVYGNASGDWTGSLAAFQGINGNLQVDPRFCDAVLGDYQLQQNSPLSADNSGGCGTIGRFEWNCPAQPVAPFEPLVLDVPGDQGGHVRISWLRHADDAAASAIPVTNYDVQRFVGGWQTVTSMAAAAADSYASVIDTPDILTLGHPAPFARYRLVARTAIPTIFYESVVDSGYSVDNLAPPKPVAAIVDGPTYRIIYWDQPGIPDLASSCVFRGDAAGFVPGEPVSCPGAAHFQESHLAWYFYRVQFADLHGNLSEFSDELHGRWPTPVPGAMPLALKMYPCRPNPFNPRTTIRFDLPDAGSVRLSVFDVAGRLVCSLVDGSMVQGSHDVVWDGRDATGREAGSGSYLARLEFGGKVLTVRMGLIR